MIDQQQLADLRAKAEAATLGPWEASEECVVQPLPKHISPLGLTGGSSIMVAECGGVAFDSPRPADAAFIAAANPATVLAMIDEIERLRGELRKAVELLKEAAPRFVSYEECMDWQDQGEDCIAKDGHWEHELRTKMDEFVERNKETK